MTQVEEPNTIRSRLDAEVKQDKEKPATGSGSKETIKRGLRNDPSNKRQLDQSMEVSHQLGGRCTRYCKELRPEIVCTTLL